VCASHAVLVTDRQLWIATLVAAIGFGGFFLSYAIGAEPLGWPFAALTLGVGLWAVLSLDLRDYTLLSFTLMLLFLLLAGVAWLGSRIS
jgi:hypothetical protein